MSPGHRRTYELFEEVFQCQPIPRNEHMNFVHLTTRTHGRAESGNGIRDRHGVHPLNGLQNDWDNPIRNADIFDLLIRELFPNVEELQIRERPTDGVQT
jgi:hypothetical protein